MPSSPPVPSSEAVLGPEDVVDFVFLLVPGALGPLFFTPEGRERFGGLTAVAVPFFFLAGGFVVDLAPSGAASVVVVGKLLVDAGAGDDSLVDPSVFTRGISTEEIILLSSSSCLTILTSPAPDWRSGEAMADVALVSTVPKVSKAWGPSLGSTAKKADEKLMRK